MWCTEYLSEKDLSLGGREVHFRVILALIRVDLKTYAWAFGNYVTYAGRDSELVAQVRHTDMNWY